MQARLLHDKLTDANPAHGDNLVMSIKEEIGRRIWAARDKAGLSLKELAEKTGTLGPSRISNYEQGTRTPGPEEAKILARALGISAAYILCVDDESSLSPDEKALLDNYRHTDSRGKSTIARIAESQPTYTSEKGPVKKSS